MAWLTKATRVRSGPGVGPPVAAPRAPRPCPRVGSSRMPATCSRVVLPEPLGPSTAQRSPRPTSQSMPSRMATPVADDGHAAQAQRRAVRVVGRHRHRRGLRPATWQPPGGSARQRAGRRRATRPASPDRHWSHWPLAHQPEPQLAAVADDDVDERLAVHARRLEGRAPPLPQPHADADVVAEALPPVGPRQQRVAQRRRACRRARRDARGARPRPVRRRSSRRSPSGHRSHTGARSVPR